MATVASAGGFFLWLCVSLPRLRQLSGWRYLIGDRDGKKERKKVCVCYVCMCVGYIFLINKALN